MVKQIIKEAMDQNPLGLKEAVAEELRARVALALESKMEEVDLDEAVEVRHDRYMRSHGKKASGNGGWFFTHKSGPVNNLDDNKEVHFHQGKFSDAAKSAKEWAKKNGHSTVYVMEEVDLDEAEQIDEISKDTVRSYADKSFRQANTLLKHSLSDQPKSVEKASKAAFKRRQFGIKAAGRRLGSDEMQAIHKNAMEEMSGLEEAKMTDAEVLSAAKALAANGKDEKTKAFGKGLVDFYKKEGSFTPAQVGGLQNIMKNASFQMAKESVGLSEVDMGQARSVQDRRDSAKSSSGNKYHVVNKNGNVVSSHDNQGDAMRAAMKNDDYRVKRVS